MARLSIELFAALGTDAWRSLFPGFPQTLERAVPGFFLDIVKLFQTVLTDMVIVLALGTIRMVTGRRAVQIGFHGAGAADGRKPFAAGFAYDREGHDKNSSARVGVCFIVRGQTRCRRRAFQPR
jgi:hypothetical protein